MAEFVIRVRTPLPAADSWRRLTDWPAHGRYVPLTTMSVEPPGPSDVGTVFTARTALGPLGFDDPMEILEWQPPAGDAPGRCRLVKRGRVMLGRAEITVVPDGTGSVATWDEDIVVAHLPKVFNPAVALSSRLLFGRVMRKLLAQDAGTS